MTRAPSTDKREAGTSRPARRRFSRRLSATHVLIAVVVILAFVLNLLVLQDRSAVTMVVVADRPLTVGTELSADAVRLVPIDASFGAIDGLVSEDELSTFDGWVLDRAIREGDLVDKASLVELGGASGARAMSIPIPIEHAAGGTLVAGDRVDVVSVSDESASFVAANLEVTGVSDVESGSIGASTNYHLVVAVSAEQALALAEAISAGSVEVVRATGAEGLDSGEDDS